MDARLPASAAAVGATLANKYSIAVSRLIKERSEVSGSRKEVLDRVCHSKEDCESRFRFIESQAHEGEDATALPSPSLATLSPPASCARALVSHYFQS